MYPRSQAFLLSIVLILCAIPSIAQQQPANPQTGAAPPRPSEAKRQTVGLVLQGGGALGLAHVGVITWMEEHHIPIDYIAGTSMGGLVGGVYATGHNAVEMRQIVNSINWDQVMAGQTPFDDLAFRRKEDAREYPNSLEFGIRKGIQFPEGFNSGQQVSLVLDKVAAPYSEIKSFNDLPTPFACVATDLVTEKPKVFRSGSLSLALRSTMSLPGIFTPVRTKDAIYADGGLLNNIPVNVAKEMGADLTVAIHLSEAGLAPNANLSTFSVLGQSLSVMISANELQNMENADILVSVPVQKWGALSFDDADAIIKAGYDAAAAKSKVLLTLAVDDATWKQYMADRASRRRTAPDSDVRSRERRECRPFAASARANGRPGWQASRLRPTGPGHHALEGLWAIFSAQLFLRGTKRPAGPADKHRGKLRMGRPSFGRSSSSTDPV